MGGGVGPNLVDGTPTEGDVRDGARSLVPPGYQVTSEKLDVDKDNVVGFATPAYAVQLEVEGGGKGEDKRSEFLRQAVSEGWLVQQQRTESTSALTLERAGVMAGVTVGGEGGVSLIYTYRTHEPSFGRMLAFSGVGALVGLVIALGGGFFLLRRRA